MISVNLQEGLFVCSRHVFWNLCQSCYLNVKMDHVILPLCYIPGSFFFKNKNQAKCHLRIRLIGKQMLNVTAFYVTMLYVNFKEKKSNRITALLLIAAGFSFISTVVFLFGSTHSVTVFIFFYCSCVQALTLCIK